MAARLALLQDVREKKETHKSRARFWEVAGSKMGQVTGGWLLVWLGVVASCQMGPVAVGLRLAMRLSM